MANKLNDIDTEWKNIQDKNKELFRQWNSFLYSEGLGVDVDKQKKKNNNDLYNLDGLNEHEKHYQKTIARDVNQNSNNRKEWAYHHTGHMFIRKATGKIVAIVHKRKYSGKININPKYRTEQNSEWFALINNPKLDDVGKFATIKDYRDSGL